MIPLELFADSGMRPVAEEGREIGILGSRDEY